MRYHFVQLCRQLLLTIVAFASSSGLLRSGGVYIEACCSIGIILVFLAIQIRVSPFYFMLHNHLEVFLGVCDVLLVGAALLYTVLPHKSRPVEYSLVAVLILSIATSIVFLSRSLRNVSAAAKYHIERGAETLKSFS